MVNVVLFSTVAIFMLLVLYNSRTNKKTTSKGDSLNE